MHICTPVAALCLALFLPACGSATGDAETSTGSAETTGTASTSATSTTSETGDGDGDTASGDGDGDVAPLSFDAMTHQTCAVNAGGQLYCWGFGDMGHLTGDASAGSRIQVPTRIGSADDWATVDVGHRGACATSTAGLGSCWGRDQGSGGLGLGDMGDVLAPTATTGGPWSSLTFGNGGGCGVSAAGAVLCWGDPAAVYGVSPTPVGIVEQWASVSRGDGSACGVQDNGTLWCWGFNDFGVIGTGSVEPWELAPVEVSPGTAWSAVSVNSHACAIESAGGLSCWGWNSNGQLGLGDNQDRDVATTNAELGGRSWRQVSAGGQHTCAIDTDGKLLCWGSNKAGQLGLGTQGGPGDPSADALTPQEVSGAAAWERVAAGGDHTCATQVDGTLWCWGANDNGQLGIDDLESRSLPAQVSLP